MKKDLKNANSHLHLAKDNKILSKYKRSTSRFDIVNSRKIYSISKRSQSAIELLILVGFLLFSFTIFFLVIQGNMSDKLRKRQDIAVKNIVLTVQDEINLAFQSSDGYSREFKIPENINGDKYEINIIDGMVYLRTYDGKYALALSVKNVTGDIQKNTNIIKKENWEIKLNVG